MQQWEGEFAWVSVRRPAPKRGGLLLGTYLGLRTCGAGAGCGRRLRFRAPKRTPRSCSAEEGGFFFFAHF